MVANIVCGKTFNILSLMIPCIPLRTTQLLRISELANSPNIRYEIFFLPYVDYFRLRAILTNGQNGEKVLSENLVSRK